MNRRGTDEFRRAACGARPSAPDVNESTRNLFRQARQDARRARSLERQAARLTEDARRDYEHGKRLFLKACEELRAADDREGSASANRARNT